jgi:hypothetical protein
MSNKRKIWFVALSLLLGSCSNLVTADRSKVPDDLYHPSDAGEPDATPEDDAAVPDDAAPTDDASADGPEDSTADGGTDG